MEHRMQAVWRILGFFIYLPIAAIVFWFFSIFVALWWLIDVLWQLITGGEGLNGRKGAEAVVRFWDHLLTNIEWVLWGRDEFQWVP